MIYRADVLFYYSLTGYRINVKGAKQEEQQVEVKMNQLERQTD